MSEVRTVERNMIPHRDLPSAPLPLRWRHNDHDGVWNHQPHGCLLNRLFRRRSKKTSKLGVTGLCVGNSPRPVNSPHKGPVTRKMFPFDGVIMTGLAHSSDNPDFPSLPSLSIILCHFLVESRHWRCSVTSHRGRTGSPIIFNCFNSLGSLVL